MAHPSKTPSVELGVQRTIAKPRPKSSGKKKEVEAPAARPLAVFGVGSALGPCMCVISVGIMVVGMLGW